MGMLIMKLIIKILLLRNEFDLKSNIEIEESHEIEADKFLFYKINKWFKFIVPQILEKIKVKLREVKR